MSKRIAIGFLGLGTIGAKVLELIQMNKERVKEQFDVELDVISIMVRDVNKKRGVSIDGIKLTTDIYEVVNNEDIDVCLECMGGAGTEITKEAVLCAMNNKKHVVMSSKKCLALYGEEIIAAANANNVQLRFEASAGGGIPICRTLMQLSKGEEIEKIYGIVNATSNYIMSAMETKNASYEEALRQAQINGYAENDPSEDVDGWDAAYKLCILLRLGMNVNVDCKELTPVSLRGFSKEQVEKAKEQGKSIKQIVYAQKGNDGKLECYIGPCKVDKENSLNIVTENNNMIFVKSSHSGTRAFYGEGAGSNPTGSVMFDDLIDVISGEYAFAEAELVASKNIALDQVAL